MLLIQQDVRCMETYGNGYKMHVCHMRSCFYNKIYETSGDMEDKTSHVVHDAPHILYTNIYDAHHILYTNIYGVPRFHCWHHRVPATRTSGVRELGVRSLLPCIGSTTKFAIDLVKHPIAYPLWGRP